MGNIVLNNLPYPGISGQLLVTRNDFIENPAIDDMQWKNILDIIGVADIKSRIDEEGNVIIQSFEKGEWVDKIKLAGQIEFDEIQKLKSINYVDYKFILNTENKTVKVLGGIYEDGNINYYELIVFPISGINFIEGNGIKINNLENETKEINVKIKDGLKFNEDKEIVLNVDDIFTFINNKLFINAGNGINENNNQLNISTNFHEDIEPLRDGESFLKLYNDNKIGVDDTKLQHKLKAGANITIEKDPDDPKKDLISATGDLSIATENPIYINNDDPENPKIGLKYDNNSLKLTANNNLYVDKDALIDNNTIDLNQTTRELQVKPEKLRVNDSTNLISVIRVEDPTGKEPSYKLHAFKNDYTYNFSNDFQKTKETTQPYFVELNKSNIISSPLKIENDKITLDINNGLEINENKLNVKVDDETIKINDEKQLYIPLILNSSSPIILHEDKTITTNLKSHEIIIDENFKKTYRNRLFQIIGTCVGSSTSNVLFNYNFYINYLSPTVPFFADSVQVNTNNMLRNTERTFEINSLPIGNLNVYLQFSGGNFMQSRNDLIIKIL